MNAAASRREVLRSIGASPAEAAELLAYTENHFDRRGIEHLARPVDDEPFVASWERDVRDAAVGGAAAVLRRRLVQLRFPIVQGMSGDARYQAATLGTGALPGAAEGAPFEAPNRLRLWLHPTAAGRIPVIAAGARADFVTLVRALTRRNEPDPVPPAMGACMVAGYVHRARLEALPASEWSTRKDAYQDRFILASDGPYSGVAADDVGETPDDWRRLSLTIRVEHECTHYLTRRFFGSMRNALHDEMLADYAGIVAAAGRYRPEWFLRFMGLEAFPHVRPGGRIGNYRGTPPLSDGAFRHLGTMVVRAVEHLGAFERARAAAPAGPAPAVAMVAALTTLTLEGLADAGAAERIAAAVATVERALGARIEAPAAVC